MIAIKYEKGGESVNKPMFSSLVNFELECFLKGGG